jgi:MoaA/NifB/PqqE/SkfB family radical SAM enzyme
MTEARIKAMNEAGLEELQISIDGVTPDHVSNWSVVVEQTCCVAKHALLRSRLPP